MKLSDIHGDRTFDVIADLIEPVTAIAMSDELAAVLKREELPEGAEPRRFMVERITKGLPKLIRNHKDDVISVLSIIGGVEPEDYVSGMTLPSLLNDVIELLNDEAFTDFLAYAAPNVVEGQSN